MPTVTIETWPRPVPARTGKTLLDVALAAGVPFPHSCRAGECGQCKSRVLFGECDHEEYDPQVLSLDERRQGLVLACRAKPRTDVTLQCLGGLQPEVGSIRRAVATVIEVQQKTHDVIVLRMQLESGLPMVFAAGQFARLQFANRVTRPYSMANRPDDPVLEFHIRLLANGQASSYVAQDLVQGDSVVIEGPYGNAFLQETRSGRIIAIAGGTGLAPMLGIVRTALQRMPNTPVRLYFGVKTVQDIYAESVLAKLQSSHPGFQYGIVLSESCQGEKYRTGMLHHVLAADETSLSDCQVYAAGPPPMVHAVQRVASSLGLGAKDMHSDPFVASSPDRSIFWKRFSRKFKMIPDLLNP